MLQLPVNMVHLLLITLGLIGLDTLLGWLGALVKGQWDWHKVSRYVETAVLPYIGGLLALAVLSVLQPDTTPAFYTTAAATDVKLVADIVAKIGSFGVPVVVQPSAQGQPGQQPPAQG